MELLVNAVIISVLGMGFVFIFLGIQVIVSDWVSSIAGKYAHLLPEPTKTTSKRPAPVRPAAAAATSDDGELVAVASAAIQKFNAQ